MKGKNRTKPSNLDFSAIRGVLSGVADLTGVPLTCMVLQDKIRTYKNTLIGGRHRSITNPTPHQGSTNLQHPEGTVRYGGIPQVLREAEASEIDRLGGQTLFAIGSVAKQLLALLCGIIIEKKPEGVKDLTWETPALERIRELRRGSVPAACSKMKENPSIRQLLQHTYALPSMNQFFFLADGVWQISDEDFLEYLDDVVRQSHRAHGILYVVAMLLELTLKQSLEEIMDKHLLQPLGMMRTFLNWDKVMEMTGDVNHNVALGQRLSSKLETTGKMGSQRHYSKSTAFNITVGMWSCTDDLCKFYNAIKKALCNESDDLTLKIVDEFFDTTRYKGRKGSADLVVANAGLVYDLTAADVGDESLNYIVRKASQLEDEKYDTKGSRLKESSSKQDCTLVYKGGLRDGFTATTYFHVKSQKFAIVLSNASGPVDITEPIARYLLKSANGYVQFMKENLLKEIQTQLSIAVLRWRAIEDEDNDYAAWSDDTRSLNGVYEHQFHRLQMEIKDGQAHYGRMINGHVENLSVMRIGALGHRLRLFPSGNSFFVDRVTTFSDLELIVERAGKVIRLVDAGHQNLFLKQ